MKTVFLGTFPDSFPIYSYLSSNMDLKAVFVVEEYCTNDIKSVLKNQSSKSNIQNIFTSKTNLNNQLELFLNTNEIDLVVVYYCSTKISKKVLDLPKNGFLNIHPGKFPENRGADPIFWTIKNQEKSTAITIHKMDEGFDTGPILFEQSVPVHFGETGGMLNSKMALFTVEALKKVMSLVEDTTNYTPQTNLNQYQNKPTAKDVAINWENQTADEIECLVNACNPKFSGATTYYQGGEIKILEVSPVDNASPMFGKTPGEIIHVHPQEGVFVCCKYGQLLRVNIIKSDAGILSGTKYATIGMQAGQYFTTDIIKKKKELIIK